MVKKGGAMSHSARRVGFLKKVKKILEKKSPIFARKADRSRYAPERKSAESKLREKTNRKAKNKVQDGLLRGLLCKYMTCVR